MLKKALIFLVLLLTLTALVSCGKDDENEQTSSGSVSICLHTWDRTPSEELLYVERNCQSAEKYLAVCTKCGIKGSPYSYGTVGDHQYGEFELEACLVTPADCKNGAVYYKSCSYCGKMSTETFVGTVLARHSYGEIMNKDTFKDHATCTSAPTYYESCSVCGTFSGAVFSMGAKLPHTDTDGDYMCDFCWLPMKVFYDVPSDKLADVDKIENPKGGDEE